MLLFVMLLYIRTWSFTHKKICVSFWTCRSYMYLESLLLFSSYKCQSNYLCLLWGTFECTLSLDSQIWIPSICLDSRKPSNANSRGELSLFRQLKGGLKYGLNQMHGQDLFFLPVKISGLWLKVRFNQKILLFRRSIA